MQVFQIHSPMKCSICPCVWDLARVVDTSGIHPSRCHEQVERARVVIVGGVTCEEARLTKKYKGLKFVDIDEENNKVMTVHKMIFQKKRGNNLYHVFATMDGFNYALKDEDEENDA